MTEDEGPWDATDSAFRDELFRVGCFLFTQFYKERTKEVRLAYVCGYRDALAYAVSWAKMRCSPGLYSVPAVALAEMVSSVQVSAAAHLRGSIVPMFPGQSRMDSSHAHSSIFGTGMVSPTERDESGASRGSDEAYAGVHAEPCDNGGAGREASDVLGSLNLGAAADVSVRRDTASVVSTPTPSTRSQRLPNMRGNANGGAQMAHSRGGVASPATYSDGGRSRRRRLDDDGVYHCGFNGSNSRRGHATESDALAHCTVNHIRSVVHLLKNAME